MSEAADPTSPAPGATSESNLLMDSTFHKACPNTQQQVWLHSPSTDIPTSAHSHHNGAWEFAQLHFSN